MGTLDDQNHANQRDYHGIKYEESQDKEKPEETLCIVALIACLFIWSAPLTSIVGWGISYPRLYKSGIGKPILHA